MSAESENAIEGALWGALFSIPAWLLVGYVSMKMWRAWHGDPS